MNIIRKLQNFIYKSKSRIVLFLAVLGPGIVTATADNDAAGVITYSLAGANFGYSILLILLVVTILLAITQEMGTRIAIISGKGLGDLIRERYGIFISVIVFLLLFTANQGTIIANFSGYKAALQMFSLPVLPGILFLVFVASFFVVKGNYNLIQKFFLFQLIFYFAYVIAAFKVRPDWGLALKSLVFPTNIILNREFIFASIAVLGTTITPWGQFFIHSYYIDKKITPDKVKYAQTETYLGALITDFFSFFMIVATASTLFVNKILLTSGEQAALAIKPFAGEFSSLLFAIGILNAGIMGILVISLSTAYVFSEFFGYRGSLNDPYEKGKIFYGIFLMQIVLGALITLIPSVSLFKIAFYTQSLNGILIPLVIFFLLKFINNKGIMGNFINNRFYNYFSVICSIIIIFSSIFVMISTILSL